MENRKQGGRWVKMNHLRSVQTRNVVVSNVMISNAPKMTCPGDPRAQTHTQIVRAYLRYEKWSLDFIFFVFCAGGKTRQPFLPPACRTILKGSCIVCVFCAPRSGMLTLVCVFVHVQMETQICGNSWYAPPPSYPCTFVWRISQVCLCQL